MWEAEFFLYLDYCFLLIFASSCFLFSVSIFYFFYLFVNILRVNVYQAQDRRLSSSIYPLKSLLSAYPRTCNPNILVVFEGGTGHLEVRS
jgi:hypothetical protein